MSAEDRAKPPTPRQLERVEELVNHPAMQPHLDKLMRSIEANLKTRGGTGALIGWMKDEVKAYESHTLKDAFGNSYSLGFSGWTTLPR